MADGKVVAVTGASSGIGLATARLLAQRGARLVLGASRAERLEEAAAAIRRDGGEAVSAVVDVSRREDMQRLVARAQETYGRLDVLVSNAGVMPIGPVSRLATDDWERMIDVNVKGVLWGVAAALPLFEAQGAGHFINVASTAARKTVPNMAVYSASKAAVLAFSDGLRQELAGKFRVTVVLPGYTATNFADHVPDEALRSQLAQYGREVAMPAKAVAEAIAYAIDQPEDVNVGEITIRSRAQP
jgi:NADP-dependent 3-hydroxy acid dehydrogenase YdfG